MLLPNDFCPPNGIKTTEYESVINWYYNGILYIYAKPSVKHTLDDAKKQIQFLKTLVDKSESKIFIDVRFAPPLTPEARKYYGSKEGRQNIIGTCLLVKSDFSRIIGNFYLSAVYKKIKTYMVTSVEDGEKWLCKLS